jgi:hypothetical protein
MDLLFLTVDEREKLFAKLPQTVQDAWQAGLRTETIDAYEPPEELQRRMREGTFADRPDVKAMFDALVGMLGKNAAPGDLPMDEFPEDALPSFLYTIGACGTEALIEQLLQAESVTQEDMQGIASLSRARHRLLEINAVLA